MSYRPYPNADRALAQVARHYPPAPVPVIEMPECLQSMADSFAKLRQQQITVPTVRPFPVDDYRLSTR